MMTLTAFNALTAWTARVARAEALTDREITRDHGEPLDDLTAEECLGESEDFAGIDDPELRATFRTEYLRAFVAG